MSSNFHPPVFYACFTLCIKKKAKKTVENLPWLMEWNNGIKWSMQQTEFSIKHQVCVEQRGATFSTFMHEINKKNSTSYTPSYNEIMALAWCISATIAFDNKLTRDGSFFVGFACSTYLCGSFNFLPRSKKVRVDLWNKLAICVDATMNLFVVSPVMQPVQGVLVLGKAPSLLQPCKG